ncbi:MAG: alcohol dehydrogenase catalytic domain-containing protein [Spirochaetia bacterium]|jgi:2-desacetyl-2-hydroxyethyl bacteriochlorophyllide A dehydrogenase
MRNNAIVIRAPHEIAMQDIGLRELRPEDARIAVKAIGICGSDVNYFKGSAQTKIPYPLVMGHEVSGEIVELGKGGNGFAVGDQVVLSPYSPCGRCYPCSIGRSNCCTDIKVYGTHINGCAMEWCDHPTRYLVKVPSNLPWTTAAMAEPLAIALHGISRLRLAAGEHVVIIGAGAIGSLSAMAALSVGAVPIMVDISDPKLRLAETYGARFAVNSATEDAIGRVREITGGRMAEAVMEISGANEAVVSSFEYVANAGRIILTGWAKSPLTIDTRVITRKEIDVLGQRNTDLTEISKAVQMISTGEVDVMAVVTWTVRFNDMAQTVAHIAEQPGANLKVVASL